MVLISICCGEWAGRCSFRRDTGKREVDVLDGLPLPGIGHVEIAVGPLDDGRIGILSHGIFESSEDTKVLAIGADGEVKRRPAYCGVVEDHHDSAVFEPYCIYAGVVVG